MLCRQERGVPSQLLTWTFPQTVDGGSSFLYSGDMNELVGRMAKGKIAGLTVTEPDLEEIFLHYYEKGGEAQ